MTRVQVQLARARALTRWTAEVADTNGVILAMIE
jgi:hypothetical protein